MQLDEIIVYRKACSGASYQRNVYLGLEQEFKGVLQTIKRFGIEEVVRIAVGAQWENGCFSF